MLKYPYFVALDLDDPDKIISLAESVKDHVGGFKLGPRLLLRHGADFSKKISELGPLFIDHKFYDIPNTMLSSIRAAFDCGASFVTVHAACGAEALTEIVKLEQELNQERPFKVLAVTVLTSFNESSVPVHWRQQEIIQTVTGLAQQCLDCGISGLVCSPFEAKSIRNLNKDLFIVTPGVRLQKDSHQDQKRVMSPADALGQGSSALVIGRPIILADHPLQVCEFIVESLT